MKLVLIPAGEFVMGSGLSADELARIAGMDVSAPNFSASDFFGDEFPQHKVRITHPFYMGATDVTVGQFEKFVEATGYKTDDERGGGTYGWTGRIWKKSPQYNWRTPSIPQGPDYPVTCMSWNDAEAFCRWIDGRLPTEAEWEYACRAGTTTRFWWGDSKSEAGQYANVADNTAKQKFPNWRAFSTTDGYVFTSPVASYRPNAWGLYDMIGNGWKWCQDRYSTDYYANSPEDNPQGPSSGHDRVLRGGSWSFGPTHCRSAYRVTGDSSDGYLSTGFRVVLAAQ